MTNRSNASAGDVLNVMLLTTAVQPPLGADTWVHLQIMRTLDPERHAIHVGYVREHAGAPTETAKIVEHEPSDRTLVPLHPGPQRPESSDVRSRAQAARTVLPALASVVRLARYIRRHDIRILHTTDRPRDALLCVLLSKITQARSIVHVHVLFNDWMSRGLRWAIQQADARIAVSAFVKSSLVAGGAAEPSTHIVLNAIDLERWQPSEDAQVIRDEFNIDASQPVVATVCRLFPEKGPEELIRAIAEVRTQIPDVQLLVVGTEPNPAAGFRDRLEQLVDELDLTSNVHFLGRREDVPAIMAACDVFAMPSFEEPFGLVFGEAMAMERPVVALDNGGTREVVEHGKQGLLSAHGDHDGLVANLQTLLSDDALRRRMGQAGRQRVLDEFQIERMGEDAAAVYRLVAS